MKVLVIYATAGAGHRKAAEAVHHALGSVVPDGQAELVDVLDYTSPFYKFLYNRTYTFLVSHMPWLWGFFFRLLEYRWMVPLMQAWRRVYNILNSRRLAEYLVARDFDCIVSTHFFPGEVAGYLKRRGKIRSRIMMVVTDFDVHPIWIAGDVDLYTAASDKTRDKLIQLGVPQDRVVVTGIPTHAQFAQPRNPEDQRLALGLDPKGFTVLLATGSFGIGPMEEVIHQLHGAQVLVVCGHNQELFQRLSLQSRPGVKILGLVNNMHELMAAADVMVTKPGGLSIAEALVSGLPLVFFNAIPGQETNNVRVLHSYGVGVAARTSSDIAAEVRHLQAATASLQSAREASRRLGRPDAAVQIIALAQRLSDSS